MDIETLGKAKVLLDQITEVQECLDDLNNIVEVDSVSLKYQNTVGTAEHRTFYLAKQILSQIKDGLINHYEIKKNELTKEFEEL